MVLTNGSFYWYLNSKNRLQWLLILCFTKNIRWKTQLIVASHANLFEKSFGRPKMQVLFNPEFNSTSFTMQSNLNYDVISAVPITFQFSIRILQIWMIANTFVEFMPININNLISIIRCSNFVINTKINFNNTVNMDINIINIVIYSTERVINRIFGRVTSPEMPTKSTLVHTKFKFINTFNNTNFSDTDQTQTKDSNFNHKFFKNKSQNYQTCQVHNKNLNNFCFRINSYFNRFIKNRLLIYRLWDDKQPRFSQKLYQISAENARKTTRWTNTNNHLVIGNILITRTNREIREIKQLSTVLEKLKTQTMWFKTNNSRMSISGFLHEIIFRNIRVQYV